MPKGIYVRSEQALASLRITAATAAIKHGQTRNGKLTPTYISYRAAWQRCYDPNSISWKNYGGRGIEMCAHWKASFTAFLVDMGERPKDTSIERNDNNRGYLCPLCCPPVGNCRWATMSEQLINQRHEEFHEERSKRKTDWWMAQTKEYRHKRAVEAALARWRR